MYAVTAWPRDLGVDLDALNGLCRKAIKEQTAEEAQRVCKRVSLDAQNMAPGSSAHIDSLLNMGELKARGNNYVEADASYSSALTLIEASSGAQSEQAADVLMLLIEYRVRRGKYVDAAGLARRALAIRQRTAGANSIGAALTRARYAELLSQSHQFIEAETEYGTAISVLEHAGSSSAESFALTVQHLGEMYERRAQYPQAETQYRRVVHIIEQNGLNYRLRAAALDRVGYACEQQDKTSEAAAHYKRALSTLRGTPTPPEIITRIQARLAALVPPRAAVPTPPPAGSAAPGSVGTR